MFVYKLSSRLDRYDPYWYGRLIALKAAYMAVGLFIANLILQPPMATLVMLVSGVGALIAEMPPINDLNKKDNLYLGYVIIMCMTIALFASTVYLKGWFIIAVSAWTYLLYFVLRKKPELYAVVSGILMIAIISLEGYNSGNFFDILNSLLFILEFSLISFWLHKLFPFMYSRIWMSSVLRSVETQLSMLEQNSLQSSHRLFEHYLVAESSLNLLTKQKYYFEASEINQIISRYHYYLLHTIDKELLRESEVELIKLDLSNIRQSICDSQPIMAGSFLSLDDSQIIEQYHQLYTDLQTAWNRLCVHVNN